MGQGAQKSPGAKKKRERQGAEQGSPGGGKTGEQE